MYSVYVNVPDVPEKIPGSPEVEVVDAYSLKVKWQQATVADGETNPITGYNILVRFVHRMCNLSCRSFQQT